MTTLEAARFVPGGLAAPGMIDLAIGYPDPSLVARELVDAGILLDEAGRNRALSYGPPGGSPVLTAALLDMLLPDDPRVGSTLITNGSIEAIDLALRSLAQLGDVLLTEDPTFPGLASVAELAGLRLVGVPTDEHGILTDQLSDAVDSVRRAGGVVVGLYTMPSASNPTGVRLSASRRHALASIADMKNLLVIEDDAYRAVRIDGAQLPTVHALIPERVLHIQSLSKVFFPGLRLALAVGPDDVISAMLRLKPVGGTSPFGSEFLVANLPTFDYRHHLDVMRRVYRARRDTAVEAVRRELPGADFSEPQGGFFLWIRLPDEIDGGELYGRAAGTGVSYLPGPLFTIANPGGQFIRISFSFESLDRIKEGVALIAEAAQAA